MTTPSATPARASGAGANPGLVLLGVTFLWGTTFVVTRDVVAVAAPLWYITMRYGLATVVQLLLFRGRFRSATSPGLFRDGFLLGGLAALGLMCQVVGQVYTTASKSAFITSLATPLTPVVALLVYRELPRRLQLAAIVVATVGLALLTRPTGGGGLNPGDVLTLSAAIIFSFCIVEIARRAPRHDPLLLTTLQLGSSTVVYLVFWTSFRWAAHAGLHPGGALEGIIALESRPLPTSPRFWAELAYMTLVATVLAVSAQTWAMGRMSASRAAIIFSLEPVFATLLALVVYGASEWPGAAGALGAGLVLGAFVLSEWRGFTAARRAS